MEAVFQEIPQINEGEGYPCVLSGPGDSCVDGGKVLKFMRA